jgi:hypothetical protein
VGKKRRVYEEIRSMVEEEAGTMVRLRKGVAQGGAWEVAIGGITKRFLYDGAGFP